MATPIELLQGALAKLQGLEQRVASAEQRVQVLEVKLLTHAQHIRALEEGDNGNCMAGGTPT
jgi:hypothetical protein